MLRAFAEQMRLARAPRDCQRRAAAAIIFRRFLRCHRRAAPSHFFHFEAAAAFALRFVFAAKHVYHVPDAMPHFAMRESGYAPPFSPCRYFAFSSEIFCFLMMR